MRRHTHLNIGQYHQHSVDQLDLNQTVLDFSQAKYSNTASFKRDMEEWRAFLGPYGITGKCRRA